jgi:hypothetical protein
MNEDEDEWHMAASGSACRIDGSAVYNARGSGVPFW